MVLYLDVRPPGNFYCCVNSPRSICPASGFKSNEGDNDSMERRNGCLEDLLFQSCLGFCEGKPSHPPPPVRLNAGRFDQQQTAGDGYIKGCLEHLTLYGCAISLVFTVEPRIIVL